jgi:tetratricopeptide (TPR) repeat protein
MRRLFLFIALTLVGCTNLQVKQLEEQSSAIASSHLIADVPFVAQKQYQCGPASLAMVMGWAGERNVTPEQLAQEIYLPSKKGSLQIDVLGGARRHGFLALPVHSLKDILTEVEAGHPVIVLENLAFSWYPIWHYAVVVGYDLGQSQITIHSGSNAFLHQKLNHFADDWERGGKWATVILPPSSLSATAGEIEHLKEAAILERLEKSSQAQLAYETVLHRWPESLGAWIGLGNIYHSLGKNQAATRALRRAANLHPDSVAAWHNLAFAYLSQDNKKLAKASAEKALSLTSQDEEATYRQSLSEILND